MVIFLFFHTGRRIKLASSKPTFSISNHAFHNKQRNRSRMATLVCSGLIENGVHTHVVRPLLVPNTLPRGPPLWWLLYLIAGLCNICPSTCLPPPPPTPSPRSYVSEAARLMRRAFLFFFSFVALFITTCVISSQDPLVRRVVFVSIVPQAA